MYKNILYILFLTAVSNVHAQPARDTFKLFFDLDVPTLSSKMEKKIDLLIYNDKIIPGSEMTIVGYADYLGSETYNKNLSMKRAENVRDYLVKYGIDEKDITLCMGRGEVNRAGVSDQGGYPTDRRVDIVMNNNVNKGGTHTKPTRPVKKDTTRRIEVTSIDEMRGLKSGSLFQLKNVYFPQDRHIMKPESQPALEQLYAVMKDNPRIRIRIEGHVCCIKNAPDADDYDTFEPHLSVNRAKAIYQYLVDRGIEPDRLTYVGYGRSRPVIPIERSEADAEKNRRVEIRIISN
jgi:outer membrane protein OmpA-like peptidoglycan-associated protein